MSRRDFTVAGAAVLGVAALGWWAASGTRAHSLAWQHRPPGAGGLRRGGETDWRTAERRFLEQCIRCGQCAVPCPVQEGDPGPRKAIRFHGADAGTQAGTPYIEPRSAPCLMCVDVPCVKACPTGALDPRLTDINHARMGTAAIVDREECLAILGLRCEVCYNRCPVRGQAITLAKSVNPRTGVHTILEPVVHKDACTGCGLCEFACPREDAAIAVRPALGPARDADQFYQFKSTRPA